MPTLLNQSDLLAALLPTAAASCMWVTFCCCRAMPNCLLRLFRNCLLGEFHLFLACLFPN